MKGMNLSLIFPAVGKIVGQIELSCLNLQLIYEKDN